MAYVGDGALRVVGHCVDDQRDAGWAVTFIAQFVHVVGASAPERCLIARSIVSLVMFADSALSDAGAQPRVRRRIAAIARGDRDLADQLCEYLAAPRVLGILAAFDARASTHWKRPAKSGDASIRRGRQL
jgi:hypothetical protein